EPLEVREVPDEHDVVGLCLQAGSPDRRVVVGRQTVALGHVGIAQSGPNLGGLTGAGFARVDHPRRPHAQVADGVGRDLPDLVGPAAAQVALRVNIFAVGLAVAHEIDAHGLNLG